MTLHQSPDHSNVTSHDAKEQVRAAIDIVDLVGSQLELRRQGRNYVATCPWHDDTRPSLQVSQERQSWRCWVCNIGGDLFSWQMRREGVDFRQALEMLAERAGIEIRRGGGGRSTGGSDEKQTLYRVMQWAEAQFHDCLTKSEQGRGALQYLADRGIHEESIHRYRLGYSPDQWQWLMDRAPSTPFDSKALENAGLICRSERSGRFYDRFKGRLMFSIRDTQSRPIAFGGRIMPSSGSSRPGDGQAAKYVNSPETRLFSKSDNVYGLDVVREGVTRRRHAVVVEGYTDAIMAIQHGLDNVVAVLGTALGERHIRLLRRFADKVTLVLDGDEAGRRRANEVLELFVAAQVDLRVVTLPGDCDPCDYVQEQGSKGFIDCIGSARDALDHKVHIATAEVDIHGDLHGAHSALEDILRTVSRAPSPASGRESSQRLREQQLLARLARQFRINESEIRSRLADLRQTSRRPRVAKSVEEPPRQKLDLHAWDRHLFEIVLAHPDLVPTMLDGLQRHHLRSATGQQLWDRYAELVAAGRPVDFGSMMTELDDPQWKTLLVDVDTEAQQKLREAPEEELAEVMERFNQQHDQLAQKDRLAELDSGQLGEDQMLDLLEEVIKNKQRQGISVPTDG